MISFLCDVLTPQGGMRQKIYRYVVLALLTGTLPLTSGCSGKLKIRVDEDTPPTFFLSGDGALLSFTISGTSGPPVWKIYGPKQHSSVSAISPIRYGEVPAGCTQGIPTDSLPPPLAEGQVYYASAVITDSEGGQIRFTIKNGKVTEVKATTR
jgi:hypothetical protein